MSSSAFLARRLSPDTRALSPFSRELRAITHSPERGDSPVDRFIPQLSAPLHTRGVSDYLNDPRKYPNVLKVEHDFDDVKRDLQRIYGVYDYEYENHPPYGPTAARGLDSPDYTESDVDAIIKKYLGEAYLGGDRHPDGERPPCPCCKDINEHSRKHRANQRRSYSPIRVPYKTDDSVMLPVIPDSPPPSVRGASVNHDPLIYGRSPSPTILHQFAPLRKSVRFDENVELQTYTPDVPELNVETTTSPYGGRRGSNGGVGSTSNIYMSQAERNQYLVNFEDSRAPHDAEEMVAASYNYNNAMDKLSQKLKAFD